MQNVLLAFDTRSIKKYVFSPHALKEIRGASSILDRINRIDMPRVVKSISGESECIYAHGGGGLFIVDKESADKAMHAVERMYLDETTTCSVTGAVVPLPDGARKDDNLRDLFHLLSHRLAYAKGINPPFVVITTHSFFRFCDSCGTLYSSQKEPGREGERLCESCFKKRQEDRLIKESADNIIAGKDRGATHLWTGLIEDLLRRGYDMSAGNGVMSRPETLNDIGDQSHPSGYLGLLYVDGDNMGRTISRLTSLNETRRFARAIHDALHDSLVDTVLEHLPAKSDRGYLPFDVLLCGGDDLVMVTTAQSAIDSAISIIRRFAERTKHFLGTAHKVSVAVILAHSRYPFGNMLKLGEEALAFAKREAARLPSAGMDHEHGMINYMVIDASQSPSFQEYYDTVLTFKSPSASKIYRTLRPYTVTDMKRLVEGARSLSCLPGTKLQQLYETCFLDRRGGSLQAMAAMNHMSDEAVVRVKNFLQSFSGPVQFPPPWISKNGSMATPLADAIELTDFVRKGE